MISPSKSSLPSSHSGPTGSSDRVPAFQPRSLKKNQQGTPMAKTSSTGYQPSYVPGPQISYPSRPPGVEQRLPTRLDSWNASTSIGEKRRASVELHPDSDKRPVYPKDRYSDDTGGSRSGQSEYRDSERHPVYRGYRGNGQGDHRGTDKRPTYQQDRYSGELERSKNGQGDHYATDKRRTYQHGRYSDELERSRSGQSEYLNLINVQTIKVDTRANGQEVEVVKGKVVVG
jgi:hypothetical protein